MSTRYRLALGIGSAVLLLGLACRDAREPDRGVDEGRVWRVGVERQLPPFAFTEGSSVKGLAVDLIEAIAAADGYDVEFRIGDTEELRQALTDGEIDIIPHMPTSAELEQRFALSLPHTDLDDGIFVRDDQQWALADNRGLDDFLIGRSVLVLSSDQSLELAKERAAEVLVRPSPAEVLRSLAAGEGACAILPKRIAQPLIDRLGLRNIQQLPGSIGSYSRGLAFAVRPEDQALLDKLEEGQVIVTRTRTYLQIYNRWQRWRQQPLWPKLLLWALAPLLVLSIWTWSLRRTVALRTTELKAEMAQRRQLEMRMQQSQKMESLGVLAGGIAHDFNNLLMGVLGNASLGLRLVPEDSPVRPRLEEIRLAGRRAAELCGQMLAYSGKGHFKVEQVDLPAMIREGEEALRGVIDKRVNLELHLTERVPAVRGDRGQLNQVLNRLVENASEALEGQVGTVTISVGSRYCQAESLQDLNLGESLESGLYVIVEVRDDGVGMDAETLNRIFEPFFSTKFTGRGLGLAATLGIVRGHGGALEVESRPNRGTVFRIYLPASVQEEGVGDQGGDGGDGIRQAAECR